MKKGNPNTINEHFDIKYGKKGSKSRLSFEENAKAYSEKKLNSKQKGKEN